MSPLTNTYGVLLISFLVTYVLYGVVLVLGVQYFRLYPSDTLTIKITVAIFLIAGTVQITTGFAWIYSTLIDNFGQVLKLDLIPVTSVVQMGCVFFLAFFSQCFFGMRIWILSQKNLFMTAPIFLMAITQFSLAILALVRVSETGQFTSIFEVKTLVILADVLIVADDLLITAELCFLLHRNRSGIKATDSVITRLLVAALNRGILSAVLAILSLVLYFYRPTTMIFQLTANPIGQVYILSAISLLQSRKSLRNKFSNRSHSLTSDIPHTNNNPFRLSNIVTNGSRSKAVSSKSTEDLESGHHRATPSVVITLHKEITVQ